MANIRWEITGMFPLYLKVASVLRINYANPGFCRYISIHNETTVAIPTSQARQGRKWLFVGSLWALIALLTGTAVIYSHRYPALTNISSFGLGYCAGLPCFNSVTPGQTRWAEVQRTFASRENSHQLVSNIITTSLDGTLAIYHRSPDETAVGSIAIIISSDSSLTAGDIVRQYGDPCGVSFNTYGTNPSLTLYYPLLSVRMAGTRLTVDTPIHYIVFGDPAVSPELLQGTCPADNVGLRLQLGIHPWRGFADMSVYRSLG